MGPNKRKKLISIEYLQRVGALSLRKTNTGFYPSSFESVLSS